MPRDISTVLPGSSCTVCGKGIRWFDNLPVLSFLFLKGKCRHCGCGISLQYVCFELLTAFVFVAVGVTFKSNFVMLLLSLVFVVLLLIISGIDYFHQIIPFKLSIPLIVFSLLVSPFNILLGGSVWFRVLNSFSSMAAAFGLLFLIGYVTSKVIKKEALGGGDPILLAGIAAFLGWQGAFTALFAASLYGLAVMYALLLFKKYDSNTPFPFGPFLSAGALTYLLLADRLKILVE